jgi:prophage antirepressor-like protein
MTLMACGTTVPIMNIDNTVWFRGNDCASILNYKDPKRAVKRHVDPEWQQTLQALVDRGGTTSYQAFFMATKMALVTFAILNWSPCGLNLTH